MPLGAYPNIIGYLNAALDNPVLRTLAADSLAAAMSGGLLAKQARKGLRMSDLGSCRREIWYKEHGKIDIPLDPIDMQLTRYDEGAINGAWIGALVAWGAHNDGWTFNLEMEMTFAGVPGHADVRLFRRDEQIAGYDRSHIVEIKTKYETGAIKNPEAEAPYQVLQGGGYCHPDNDFDRSQTFTLLVVSPCAKKGDRAQQFHFDAEPYHALVANDLRRMKEHLNDPEPPEGDPADRFRCFTCGASACAKNKNKQQESPEALFA